MDDIARLAANRPHSAPYRTVRTTLNICVEASFSDGGDWRQTLIAAARDNVVDVISGMGDGEFEFVDD